MLSPPPEINPTNPTFMNGVGPGNRVTIKFEALHQTPTWPDKAMHGQRWENQTGAVPFEHESTSDLESPGWLLNEPSNLRDVLGRKFCWLRTTGFPGIGSVAIAVEPDATVTRPVGLRQIQK